MLLSIRDPDVYNALITKKPLIQPHIGTAIFKIYAWQKSGRITVSCGTRHLSRRKRVQTAGGIIQEDVIARIRGFMGGEVPRLGAEGTS